MVGVLFSVPVLLVGFFFLKEVQSGIFVAESERAGVRTFEKLVEVRRHLTLAASPSVEDASARDSHIQRARTELQELAALQRVEPIKVLSPQEIEAFNSALPSGVTSSESTQAVAKSLRELNDLSTKALNSSQLALDPEVSSYYLMSAQSFQLRHVLSHLFELLTQDPSSPSTKRVHEVVGRGLEISWQTTSADFSESLKVAPQLSKELSDPIAAADRAIRRVQSEIGDPTVGMASTASIEAAVNSVSDLRQQTLGTLDTLLVERRDRFASRRTGVLAASAAFFLLAVGGLMSLYATTLGQLRHSIRQAQRIAKGDFTVVQATTAEDEFGKLANDFSALAQGLEKTSNIAEQIANGDLSSQFAPRGKDDQLGQSLARMQENLRSLVYDLVMGVSQLELAADKVNLSVSETEDVSNRVMRMMTSLHGECEAITRNVSEASTFFSHHLELTEKCQKSQLQSLEALEGSSDLFVDVSATAVRLKEVMTRMEIALQVQAQTGTGRGAGVEKLQANWEKTEELIFDLLRGYYQLEHYVRELRLQLSHSADVLGEAFSHREAKILEFESSIATVETMVAAIQEIQAEMLQLRDSNAHLNEVNQAISVASNCLRDGVSRFKLHGDRADAFEISEAFLLEESA